MKKLSMVLWYAAGIRDLAEMNKHLILEQLIVGRKHKKVQERLLEKGKVLSLVEAIEVGWTHKACRNWRS